jgi:hypothetical protein
MESGLNGRLHKREVNTLRSLKALLRNPEATYNDPITA